MWWHFALSSNAFAVLNRFVGRVEPTSAVRDTGTDCGDLPFAYSSLIGTGEVGCVSSKESNEMSDHMFSSL